MNKPEHTTYHSSSSNSAPRRASKGQHLLSWSFVTCAGFSVFPPRGVTSHQKIIFPLDPVVPSNDAISFREIN